jgi:hypothetical protein
MEGSFRLRRFLDNRERVATWPAKQQDKRLVLKYLATKFEAERDYTEKEVNALLKAWHTFGDYVLLRRYLFDYGLLDRERNGSRYWRTHLI